MSEVNIESRRISTCWSCNKSLKDLPTCPICGWMICPDCGSCRSPLYNGGCLREFTNSKTEMNHLRTLWSELPIENRPTVPSDEFSSWVQIHLDEWKEHELQQIRDQKRNEEEQKLADEQKALEIKRLLEKGQCIKDKLNRTGRLDHFYSDGRFQYVAIQFENGVSSYRFPDAFREGFIQFI